MGLARVIEEANKKGAFEIASELTSFLINLLDEMKKYQMPDGRFKDILDKADSFTDGTSSMMFAATIYRGINAGYVPEKYRECADTAYESVSKYIDEYGIIRQVAGCPDFVSEGTSAEAQAAYIMADAWRQKV